VNITLRQPDASAVRPSSTALPTALSVTAQTRRSALTPAALIAAKTEFPLVARQRRPLARGAEQRDAVATVGEAALGVCGHLADVDAPILSERRRQGGR